MVSPIVSLQAPKDVSIEEIEAELLALWQMQGSDEDGATATRAATFSLLVYEPDGTQQLLASLGFYKGPIDGISGSKTEAAIKAAQQAYNLKVTGKTNPEFLNRLKTEFTKAKAAEKLTSENKTAAVNYNPDSAGGMADAIAASNPCRIVTLCPILGEDTGVKAQVSAYCPIDKRSKNTLVCCEYISLIGTAEALERIGGIIAELAIADLPSFIWWKATPAPEHPLFKRLMASSDAIIFDSSSFHHPEADLITLAELLKHETTLADINWSRLAPWQELSAAAFDPPERRAGIYEVDRVTIDYELGNQSQALLFLGWLASRLQWTPVEYQYQGGDYDIRQVKFSDDKQRSIEAELAGIPTADWGDIPGDLISLRLNSTNLDADCCTVLCSSTSGCMRMEAKGGAQACYIEEVAPLSDQKTETLIGKQLQRWGRDMLYEESMAVVAQILELSKNK